MYLAELHGKLSSHSEQKEDILTSNVFSFFKYSYRNKYLKSLMEELKINDVTEKDLKTAEFIFWPTYDNQTEPDLVIIIGGYYLLFEAKYFSDVSIEQIKREIIGGEIEAKNVDKEFYYIAITKDYNYPFEKFKDIKNHMKIDNFRWINWQKICYLIENNTDNLMALDLYHLMLKKNLRKFQGFNLVTIPEHFSKIENVFFDFKSSKYRGDFIGFIKSLEIFDKKMNLFKGNIFYSEKYFQDFNIRTKLEYHTKIFFGGKE